MLDLIFFGALVVISVQPAMGDDSRFGGHLKYQGSYDAYSGDDALDHFLDGRLNGSYQQHGFEAIAQAQFLALSADRLPPLQFLTSTSNAFALPDDRRRLFDLTSKLDDEGKTQEELRLDRLSLAYNGEGWSARAGRQAVTWGNGLVFSVLDVFNPFSPLAIDKEYKTGDDMLYFQRSLGENVNGELLAVPRRDLSTHDVENAESSYAGKIHVRAPEYESEGDLLYARHRDANMMGGGVSKNIWDGVGRFDIATTSRHGESPAWSFLINYDRSLTVLDKNLYGFIEFYRNGFGTARERYLSELDLLDRFSRGELYTLGTYYAAPGVRYELYPRTNIFGSVVWNLVDGSYVAQSRVVQELAENFNFVAGINVPVGELGSEFGGPEAGVFRVRYPVESFVRLERYF